MAGQRVGKVAGCGAGPTRRLAAAVADGGPGAEAALSPRLASTAVKVQV
jgi:hypothetical protein